MEQLIQNILQKEPGAIMEAAALGQSASPAIMPLARSEDPFVREMAMRCLNRAGGREVGAVLIEALADESPAVRAAALQGLSNHVDQETSQRLGQIYETIPDSQHRQEVALMLGKLGESNLTRLRQMAAAEQDAEAFEGCLAALAKLGDERAQAEFLRGLVNAKNLVLKRFLEYVEYIGDPWVLEGLSPFLEDRSPLAGTGVCPAPPGAVEYLRVCDAAVNLIARLARAGFSFPVDDETNYSDRQIAEARRFLESLST